MRETVASRPIVGLGLLVIRINPDDSPPVSVLLGKRKNSHGSGKWSLPGGHLENFETIDSALRRELSEETGITDISDPSFINFSEDFFPEIQRHYITLYYYSILKNIENVEPKNLEPDKHEAWEWFSVKHLPENVWHGVSQALRKIGY